MAVYGYIRVSTDKQTVENQRFEISNFVKKENIFVDRWIEETVSGTKKVDDRRLGKTLKKLKKGDILICAELSRLGRSLLMIMGVLNYCMEKSIEVWTIKDNFRLGKDINSQVLAFAFGLSAQIERDLISMRTKEALARKKAEGVILGRPKGSKSKATKLKGMESKIKSYLDAGLSFSAIGRLLGVHRLTVSKFVNDHILAKNIVGDGDIEMDPITAIQLSKLIDNKDVVLHLLSKRKSLSDIGNFYKVEPFVVSIFRTKFKDSEIDMKVIGAFEAKNKIEVDLKRELVKLNKDAGTVKMLLGSNHSKESIAELFNVSIRTVNRFKQQ